MSRSLPYNLAVNMPWSPLVCDGKVKLSDPCLGVNKGYFTVMVTAATSYMNVKIIDYSVKYIIKLSVNFSFYASLSFLTLITRISSNYPTYSS